MTNNIQNINNKRPLTNTTNNTETINNQKRRIESGNLDEESLAKVKKSLKNIEFQKRYLNSEKTKKYLLRDFNIKELTNNDDIIFPNFEQAIYDQLQVPFRYKDVCEEGTKPDTFYSSGHFVKRINTLKLNNIKVNQNQIIKTLDANSYLIDKTLSILELAEIINALISSGNAFLDEEILSLSKDHSHTFITAYIEEEDDECGHAYATTTIIDNKNNELISIGIFDSEKLFSSHIEKIEKEIINHDHIEFDIKNKIKNYSLEIQVEDNDYNCSIYTHKVCKTLIKMLLDPKNSLKNDLISNNDNAYIQNKVKANMPKLCKKDTETDYIPHDYETIIKPYMLQKRWKYGKQYIENYIENLNK